MSIEQLKKKLESESKGTGIKYNEESCVISLDEKEIGQWNNEANQDYPEDLIWSRDISSLYMKAFQSGHEAATNRLLPLLEKAVDEIKCIKRRSKRCNECGAHDIAEDFLSDFMKMTEINKEFGE